jgi:ABC-2 type transport system permease protein
MNLPLLYLDELRGFYRSKVMLFLWVGLPVVAILLRFVQTSQTGQAIPFTVISALVVSSLAGTLAAVMLTVSIINEKNRNVYELFLIRPIKRSELMLSKFLAVYSCVAIAAFVAVMVSTVIDLATGATLPAGIVGDTSQSLAISLSMLAVSCSAGVLIGVGSPSVLVGAILVIYGGNQISVIPLIPTLLGIADATLFTIGIAAIVAVTLLTIAIALFERKQF